MELYVLRVHDVLQRIAALLLAKAVWVVLPGGVLTSATDPSLVNLWLSGRS